MLLRVNTTGHEVDRTLTVGGRELAIRFNESEGSLFAISISNASINIKDVVFVEGSVSYTAGRFAGSGLIVFVGDGPLTLANGERNPLARGVLLRDATIGVINVGSDYALDARGVVEFVGFEDVTAEGTFRVRANTFDQEWNEVLTIPGTDLEVPVVFGSSEKRSSSGAAFISASAVGLQLKVFGQSLAGDFAFTKQTDGFSIVASNVELAFGDEGSNVNARGPPFFQLTNGSGTITVTAAGVVADLAATVALDLDGVSLGGTFRLQVNTTTATATVASGTLPAGPYFRISGQGAHLTIFGQQLTGNFSVEQTTVAGATTTHITADHVTADFGVGTTNYLSLQNGEGEFTLSTAGVTGRLSADVSVNNISQFDLSARHRDRRRHTAWAASTSASRRPASRSRSPPRLAHRQLRVREDDRRERRRRRPRRARATCRSRSRAGGSDVLSLTNGSGNLLLVTGGLAADFTGTVAVNLPGVSLAGTLHVQINTTSAEVDQKFDVGGVETLLVPAGGPVPPLRSDRPHAERPRSDADRRRDVHEVEQRTSRSRSRTRRSRSAAGSSPSPERARA